MEKGLYCIYDVKAEAPVNQIFQCFGTDPEATRMFASVIQTPGTIIHEHPADFQLLRIGSIDFDTLKVTPNLSSRHIPIAEGRAIVRELQRARQAANGHDGDDPASDVVRNQIPLLQES